MKNRRNDVLFKSYKTFRWLGAL